MVKCKSDDRWVRRRLRRRSERLSSPLSLDPDILQLIQNVLGYGQLIGSFRLHLSATAPLHPTPATESRQFAMTAPHFCETNRAATCHAIEAFASGRLMSLSQPSWGGAALAHVRLLLSLEPPEDAVDSKIELS